MVCIHNLCDNGLVLYHLIYDVNWVLYIQLTVAKIKQALTPALLNGG